MKAEINPSYDKNRKRLADVIPLVAPFTVYIEPTRYCNFKCFYCMHSTRGIKGGVFEKAGYEIKHMPETLYANIIDQLCSFQEQVKRIVFSGLGEPLMNPRLAEMVRMARDRNVAHRIDIITNAGLLTPERVDALVSAGISRIQISVQGIDAATYKETCGADIDFDRYVSNIRYLYEHKRKSTVFIKIIDVILKKAGDNEQFYKIFGDICDNIYIEHLIKLQQQMGDIDGRVDNSKNYNNEDYKQRNVCAVPFYQLQLDVDGNVFPCPPSGLPKNFGIGNVYKETLLSLWNGGRRNRFLRTMLSSGRCGIPFCSTCDAYSCVSTPEEDLDNDAPRLHKIFE